MLAITIIPAGKPAQIFYARARIFVIDGAGEKGRAIAIRLFVEVGVRWRGVGGLVCVAFHVGENNCYGEVRKSPPK
jgi:hypothetical protein